MNGKLSHTQVKCTWLLPTYVKQVDYARVRDIDSTYAKKLKANLDKSIENLETKDLPQFTTGTNDVRAPVSRHDKGQGRKLGVLGKPREVTPIDWDTGCAII